ncbi:hypothetical protein KPH14_007582 [Odynerus spinipes]|uniref:Uncharacterized protein n=1 Tax=Odynerus spinipes TaxID=1348599 RepID=A0AAD9VN81_9HYME|nr:hypothetical protein KPH14_007582 [Odynerus spinipes]
MRTQLAPNAPYTKCGPESHNPDERLKSPTSTFPWEIAGEYEGDKSSPWIYLDRGILLKESSRFKRQFRYFTVLHSEFREIGSSL